MSDPDYTSTFTRKKIDLKQLEKILKKGSNHGVCGGHNLGNTCFMNSSIACLSNCTELTTYFLSGEYKKDINKKNDEGAGGKLAESWHDLLEEYWNSSAHTGDPRDVKSVVGRKVRKFSGYSQQDSNEFMTEFLSILNEDLNKTDKKEYKELKEKGEDESEFDCAKRFWDLHLKLNDSIVTDLFSGLLKSVVTCQNCNYKNITFDPFNTLTLAIPPIRELYSQYVFFYIPKYSIRKSCKIELIIQKDPTLKIVVQEARDSKDFKYDLNKLKFINVSDGKLVKFVDENEILEKIEKRKFIFAFDDQSKEGENNKILPLYFFNDGKISAFPRLLFLEGTNSFEKLKHKIYYLARNYFINPFDDKEIENELKEYKEKIGVYDEQILWNLFDKEYNEIFTDTEGKRKEQIEKFMKDFPYKIVIKKKFEDKEGICIFDGKNNLDNLKEFGISKDEDSISTLLDKLENNEYCLNLYLNSNSEYSIEKIRLDSCESFIIKKKEELNLGTLINFFCSKEQIEKGNEWYCSKCDKRIEVTKKFSIFYVPRLMIICLSRFSKESRYGYGSYGKNGEFIDFPLENLDMGKYISGPDKEHSIYDLFAVSQHFGGTGGGHYTAVCKNYDGNWYSYNDSSCSRTTPSNVVSSSAYVLFYRRRNW